jgi:methionyl-tRNA formyltransferase
MDNRDKIKFTFFGSSRFSTIILDTLEEAGFIATTLITLPDKPQGRKMLLTSTPVKSWGQKRDIEVYEPEKLDQEFVQLLIDENMDDVFIVASYGKIIPNNIIELPKYKTLNVHPSLLPKYRGASPLQSTIIEDDKDTGVTIIRIDEQMDHGPIIAQREIHIDAWPIYEEFEEMMAKLGGGLLAEILPDWVSGNIIEKEQDHVHATYTKKIEKVNSLIKLTDDPYLNFRKIQAYHGWPQAYFIVKHKNADLRVKVTQADFKNGQLIIEKVIPEGGKEMGYDDFVRGYTTSKPASF